jgi:tetratricopeptide (TPR) repeat protein
MKKKIKYKQNQAVKKQPAAPIRGKTKSEKGKYYVMLAIILLISFLVYLPVLNNKLLAWDDDLYLKTNPLVHSINLKDIFSKYVMGNYHPLTILTFAIEYKFFGLNGTGYHVINLLLHLLNVTLVFYSINLLVNKPIVALVASLLFGIHPLHVESVAWAAELKDLLYAFFFLASYILYLKYLTDHQKKFYIFSLVLFCLSLLSKAMAASLPVVLLLTDYFKGRKINGKVILEKLPFIVLSIGFGIVAVWAQKSAGATEAVNFSFPERMVFACYGFITYIIQLFFPLNLSAYYPYPVSNPESIPTLYYIYPVFLAGLVTGIFYSLKVTRKYFFGIGFFAVTIFLVLQLLPVGGAIIADRYSYIPSIGIFYLAGEGFNFLLNKKLRAAAFILLGIFTIFFSIRTFLRCDVWRNDLTLWNNVIGQYQTVPLAYYNRGHVYLNEGKNDSALRDFNKAIELQPTYANAYNNRGILYMNENKNDEALRDFDSAVVLKPNSEAFHLSRGNALKNKNAFQEALAEYDKALSLKPDFAEAFYSRGILFMNQGKHAEAVGEYSKAISLNPDYIEAYLNRANSFRDNNQFENALKDYEKVIMLDPNFILAYFNRGTLYMNRSMSDLALKDFDKAIQLNPAYAQAHHNKANIFYNEKKYDEAIINFSQAIKVKPDFAVSYYSRGLAEYYSGRKDAACLDFKTAVNLGYQPAATAIVQVCN